MCDNNERLAFYGASLTGRTFFVERKKLEMEFGIIFGILGAVGAVIGVLILSKGKESK